MGSATSGKRPENNKRPAISDSEQQAAQFFDLRLQLACRQSVPRLLAANRWSLILEAAPSYPQVVGESHSPGLFPIHHKESTFPSYLLPLSLTLSA